MTMEQEFYHAYFMNRASKIDKVDDLVEILDLLHANYLVQKRLFSNLYEKQPGQALSSQARCVTPIKKAAEATLGV